MAQLRSLSLFSGCQGLDLGMEKKGIKACAFVDSDSTCRETIRINCPRAIIFKDVFDSEVLNFARNTQIDVVVGGPPCQSFSTIGKRDFLHDPRGKALLGFIAVVKAACPEYFVLENVQGIISAEKGKIIRQLRSHFVRLGYNVSWSLLNASDFGVPQLRKRFVMLGCKSRLLHMPIPKVKPKTLREAICDLEEHPGSFSPFSDAMQEVMSHVPEGGCWRDLPTKMQDKSMGNANRKSGGLTAFYRRLAYNKPSPTLLTSPTQRATTLCHPKQTRPLSVLEYKRIQCFPDNWKLAGSTRSQYRQLGNAVPVLLGKAIGNMLIA